MLLRLFDHLAWADARARDAVASLPAGSGERAQALVLYAHLAGAEHVWLTRLDGRPAEHPVWPALDLDAATALARANATGLRAHAALDADGLARVVAYRNNAGQPFQTRVDDILAHLALHGSYHRGQIALLARGGGGAPASTDYIAFVWAGGGRRRRPTVVRRERCGGADAATSTDGNGGAATVGRQRWGGNGGAATVGRRRGVEERSR